MGTLLTSWHLGYVDIQIWDDAIQRIVLDSSDYDIFVNKMKNWEKYLKLRDDYVFWSQIKWFGKLKIDEDALEQYKKLEKNIQEYVARRIKNGYRVQTLSDLRFAVVLYYENQTASS
jgi:glutaredoxin-related protein